MNNITSRLKCFKSRRGEPFSVGDASEFLHDLLKKRGGYFSCIRLEVLVALNEKRSNRRREYTGLESIVRKVNSVPNVWKPFSNAHI